MKRKRAKEILADSFLELARTKSIEKITVNDITANCDYSPSTFYRYYKDKYDLIACYYAEKMKEMLDRIGVDGYSWDDAYLDSVRYYESQKDFLANLFLHTTGLDSFIEHMTDINCKSFQEYLKKTQQHSQPDTKTELLIRLYCLGASKLVSEWILGKCSASAEELATVMKEAFVAYSLKTGETAANLS